VACYGFVGRHDALVEQAGGWGSPQSLHALDKTRQLGQLLRDLRLGDESALAPPDLDEPALEQILTRAVPTTTFDNLCTNGMLRRPGMPSVLRARCLRLLR
jgi:hypothetical protein